MSKITIQEKIIKSTYEQFLLIIENTFIDKKKKLSKQEMIDSVQLFLFGDDMNHDEIPVVKDNKPKHEQRRKTVKQAITLDDTIRCDMIKLNGERCGGRKSTTDANGKNVCNFHKRKQASNVPKTVVSKSDTKEQHSDDTGKAKCEFSFTRGLNSGSICGKDVESEESIFCELHSVENIDRDDSEELTMESIENICDF